MNESDEAKAPHRPVPVKVLGAGLLVITLLTAVLVRVEGPAIETQLEQGLSRALVDDGFARVAVSMSGRDAQLAGFVSDEIAARRLVHRAATVAGVRAIATDLEYRPLRFPHLVISRDRQGALRVAGEMPGEELARRFTTTLATDLGHKDLESAIALDPEVSEPRWANTVIALAPALDPLAGLHLEIGAGSLSVGGLIDNEADYEALVAQLREGAVAANLRFVNRIGIRPDDDDPLLSAVADDSTTGLAAAATLPESASEGLPSPGDDESQDAAEVSMIALSSPDQAGSASSTDIATPGPEGEMPISTDASRALPSDEAMAAGPERSEDEGNSSAVAEADLSAVEVPGTDESGDTPAQSAEPAREEESSLWEDVPAGESLEDPAMGEAASTSLVPAPDIAAVAALETPASSPVPSGTDVSDNEGTAAATVVESGTAPPGWEVCQLELNDALSAERFIFPSNSAVMPVDNSTLVKKIAEIMEKCATYEIYIQGHTDSRGPSVRNLQLSQERAENVKDALVTAGVNASRLHPVGYGARFPIADNRTAEGRRLNRRIEFIVRR